MPECTPGSGEGALDRLRELRDEWQATFEQLYGRITVSESAMYDAIEHDLLYGAAAATLPSAFGPRVKPNRWVCFGDGTIRFLTDVKPVARS